MKLSAPVHVLKRKAKELKRSNQITLTEALNQVAKAEGFASWSLLQSRINTYVPKTKDDVLKNLFPGDLLLIGARPGLGKTTLALQLLLRAIKEDRVCFFFSLEYTPKEAEEKLSQLDETYEQHKSWLKLDCSDDISSDYIIARTQGIAREGSLIAVDYLQLLDQQRNKPSLQKQIKDLKTYARETKCILIFISQIDRAFEQKGHARPGLEDVRLPNPLNLGLFNKSIFTHDDQMFF